MTSKRNPLPDPVVSPDEYTDFYYRNWCNGYQQWTETDGATMHPMYRGYLLRAELRPGEVVVDIGTGRGELLVAAAEMGAAKALGVEYAPAGLALARRTIELHGAGDRAEVVLADARAMPVSDSFADLVTMLDVVEHLAPRELERALAEAFRVLRPGGRLMVHTLPNRTLYEVTYRLQRWSRPARLRTWPADPRNDYEHTMHVNEQTVTTMRRSLRRAGFSPVKVSLGQWIVDHHVPDEKSKRLYPRLARFRLTARFGAGDIWGDATKPVTAEP